MRIHATAFLLASSALTLAVPAWAQDAAAEDKAEESSIIVTGTRIVRDGYEAPTPVTVAMAEELLRSTPSGIADGLNKLPQFSNSLSAAKGASNFSNLPIHGNILNLRGLGTTGANPKGPLRTLILFDGLRVAPTEYTGTIDTNVLPQLLMSRVDVVTGGASAAWGSDAVAGVVNFVLDKKFKGITGVAQAGLAEGGYAHNQRFGVAGGFGFDGDRGHVLLSAEYNNHDGMRRDQFAASNLGYAYVGATPGCVNPSPATEPTACLGGGRLNPLRATPGILIATATPTGRFTAASNAGNSLAGAVINPDGSTRAFVTGNPTGTAAFNTASDGFKISSRQQAIIPAKNYQGFGRLSYELTDSVNAYAQAVVTRSDFAYPTQTNAILAPTNQLLIFSGNSFLTPAMQAALPTANDFYTFQQYDAGQPQPFAEERTDYWQATLGLDGEAGNFKWALSYSHGSSKHTMDTSGLYDTRKFYAATDVVTVGGVPTCRVLTTAFASQYAGCQPLNVLRGDPSATSPAGYAYATGTSSYRAMLKQDSVVASLSGSFFEMPAGPVDFTVGAEYRHQSLRLTTNADPKDLLDPAVKDAYFAGLRNVPRSAPTVLNPNGIALPLAFWLTNVGSANGTENVKEAFLELAVPLLKDSPGFEELGLNGAVRYTDYSVSGGVTTWKIGAIWKPIQDLTLRATYSRDIRAPNLFELFSGPQSAIGLVNDQRVGSIGSGLNQNVTSAIVGNPNLKPEKAKTLTLGGVVSPSGLPGFSMSIDYYNIKIDGLIDQLSAQQIVNNCTNSGGTAPDCASIDRGTPTSLPTLIRILPTNLSFLKTSGIDFDASYRTELGSGNLAVRLYANYLSKFDVQQFIGAPILRYGGVSVVASNPAAYPRWRGNLTLDYTAERWGVTLSEQLIGGMRLDIPGQLAGGIPLNFTEPNVGAVWYSDLTLRGKFSLGKAGNLEPFVTINNLFNKKPPLIPGTIPGVNLPTNIAVYDFVGRAFTAGVRFKF